MILYEKRDLAQKSDLLGLIFLPESIISIFGQLLIKMHLFYKNYVDYYKQTLWLEQCEIKESGPI